MRKSWIIGALVILLGLAVAWYFGSPAWTLKSMASAAQKGDADKLASYIDFPKVRESAKSQLKAQMAAKMMSGDQNGFAAIGMMIGMQMVDPMIDAVVSPESMRAAFARRAKGPDKAAVAPNSPSAGPSAGKVADKPFGIDTASAEIVRTDFDHFQLRDKKQAEGGLVFERRGFGWVLMDIRMPPKLLEGPSSGASE